MISTALANTPEMEAVISRAIKAVNIARDEEIGLVKVYYNGRSFDMSIKTCQYEVRLTSNGDISIKYPTSKRLTDPLWSGKSSYIKEIYAAINAFEAELLKLEVAPRKR